MTTRRCQRRTLGLFIIAAGLLSGTAGCVATVDSVDVNTALESCSEPLGAVNSCLENHQGDQAQCVAVIQQFQSCLTDHGTRAMASDITGDALKALREKARACYEQKNTACLKAVYSLVAVGGFLKGLPVASKNMTNFLYIGKDPQEIDPNALKADQAVQDRLTAIKQQAEPIVVQQIKSKNKGPAQYPLFSGVVGGASKDIWYGLGSFTLIVDAQVTLSAADPSLAEVKLSCSVKDRYDWHPGLVASGEEQGMALFEDAWAQFLVDQKAAYEFDMVSSWEDSYFIHAVSPPVSDGKPPTSKDGGAPLQCPASCTNGCNAGTIICKCQPACPTSCTSNGSCPAQPPQCPASCTNGCNTGSTTCKCQSACPTSCASNGSCPTPGGCAACSEKCKKAMCNDPYVYSWNWWEGTDGVCRRDVASKGFPATVKTKGTCPPGAICCQ